MENKNLKYLLIGGAAVVASALLLYFSSSAEGDDEEESMDEVFSRKVQELLPLERDHSGMIPFDKFLKIFEMSSVYGKTKFAEKRKGYVAERREALADENMTKYE